MKETLITTLLALLAGTCSGAPAPYPITVNSRAASAPAVTVKRSNVYTVRASFVDGTNQTVCTGYTPFCAWSTNELAAQPMGTSSWAWVGNASTGICDFTFAPASLNYTPGRYLYEVGVYNTSGVAVIKSGVFLIEGSPYATTNTAFLGPTNLNFSLYTLIGAPWITDAPVDGTAYARQDAGWVASGGTTVDATARTAASNAQATADAAVPTSTYELGTNSVLLLAIDYANGVTSGIPEQISGLQTFTNAAGDIVTHDASEFETAGAAASATGALHVIVSGEIEEMTNSFIPLAGGTMNSDAILDMSDGVVVDMDYIEFDTRDQLAPSDSELNRQNGFYYNFYSMDSWTVYDIRTWQYISGQLSTATNDAVGIATGLVGQAGYLLPVNTQDLVTATQLSSATNDAVTIATNLADGLAEARDVLVTNGMTPIVYSNPAAFYPSSNPSNFVDRLGATQGMQVAGAYLLDASTWSGYDATQQVVWVESAAAIDSIATNLTLSGDMIPDVSGVYTQVEAIGGYPAWHNDNGFYVWVYWEFYITHFISVTTAERPISEPSWVLEADLPTGIYAEYGDFEMVKVETGTVTVAYSYVTNWTSEIVWRAGYNVTNGAWQIERDGEVLATWGANSNLGVYTNAMTGWTGVYNAAGCLISHTP